MNKYKEILKEVKKDFKRYLNDAKNGVSEYNGKEIDEIINYHIVCYTTELIGGIPFSSDPECCDFIIPELLHILQYVDAVKDDVQMSFEQKSFSMIAFEIIAGQIWDDVYRKYSFDIDEINKKRKMVNYD